MYYEKLSKRNVICKLCPHNCVIGLDSVGICGVRRNVDGVLISDVYGKIACQHTDPIEKKPLYHFLPGAEVYSIGTVGCNFRCKHCQNFDISTAGGADFHVFERDVDYIISQMRGKSVIAYTYNEPTVFFEFMLECAKAIHAKKKRNVLVTNGFISEKPLLELAPYLDCVNVDLKGFSDEFYRDLCGGELEPVLESLKILKEAGVWIEITNLLIPTYNDDPSMVREMCQWIVDNLGEDTPIHFSAFRPMHRLRDVSSTPYSTLRDAEKIAREVGMNYVYLGNVGHENYTLCPECGGEVVRRHNYDTHVISKGICRCGLQIPGVWK